MNQTITDASPNHSIQEDIPMKNLTPEQLYHRLNQASDHQDDPPFLDAAPDLDGQHYDEGTMVTFAGGSNSRTGELIVTIGGPGVGKTFVIKNVIHAEFTMISSDVMLEMFADISHYDKPDIIGAFQRSHYDDPSQITLKNPEVTRDLHNLLRDPSKRLRAKILTAFAKREPQNLPNILIDTTGQDIKKLIDLAHYGSKYGYRTTLVYVFVDRDIAWARNQARSRTILKTDFDKIHDTIPTVFNAALSLFDNVWTVESENDLVWSKSGDIVTKLNPNRVKKIK